MFSRLAPKFFWFLLLTPTMFGFDFFTKRVVSNNLGAKDQISIIPDWLAIVHAENPGAAFSMPVPHWLIYTAGMLMLAVLLYTLWHLEPDERVPAASLALIASGGLGNAIDRIGDGTVTDFVYFYTNHPTLTPWLQEHVGMTSWPVFNVADVALIAGVILYMVHQMFWERDDEDSLAPA